MAVVEKHADRAEGEDNEEAAGRPRGCTTALGLNLTIDAHFWLDRNNRLKLQVVDPKAPGLKLLDVLPKLFRRTLGVQRAEKIFGKLSRDRRGVHFFQKAIDAFELTVKWPTGALERIPRHGPLIVVANHALNGVDGMAIAYLVHQVRLDVKAMMTATFDGFPGMTGHSIFVCDSNGPSATSRTQPTREAVAWLRRGHALILFPAAQGSWVHDPRHRNPVDVPWLKGTSLLIRLGKANVLPVYVHGAPGKLFLAMKRFFQPASFVLLVREIVNQRGSTVRLEVGEALSHQRVAEAGDAEAQLAFLRQQTYDLAPGPRGAHSIPPDR